MPFLSPVFISRHRVSKQISMCPISADEEAFSENFARPGLKIERIISRGQVSPTDFWYDQAWNEWVIVLKGSATLQFEGEPTTRALGVGDYVSSLAKKRHRVEWTEPQKPTVWLAVHFE
jgi:cupin 2 domain-containing protein